MPAKTATPQEDLFTTDAAMKAHPKFQRQNAATTFKVTASINLAKAE